MSFGSSLGDGAVSALNWANKIYIIMVGVFAYAITNFIFPKLSRLSVGDNNDEFADMIVSSGCDKNPEKKRYFNPPEIVLITLERETN